jgi:cobalt-zinc-cadmium efflux system outer membrane protein
MHDRFIISGNQRNSVNAGLVVSLPIFDWGQAREQAAERRADAARSERELRVQAAQSALAPLAAQLASERERQHDLSERLVPLARNIVDQLETAVEGRLVPLGDLIQARRTLDELLVQEADSYADAFHALLSLSEQSGGEL